MPKRNDISKVLFIGSGPKGRLGQHDDSYSRKAAIKCKISYITTVAAAVAAVKGITAFRQDTAGPSPSRATTRISGEYRTGRLFLKNPGKIHMITKEPEWK